MKIAFINRISSLYPLLGYGPALRLLVCVVFLALVAVPHALAVNNGLGRTPAMGWNSWNHYGCGVSEAIIKQVASTMASNGMKAAGYEYVNLDDCWMATSRTSAGALVADPNNFPDGMAALASYVHSLGLKIGLYEDMGTATCQGRPGSYGHYAQDIATYISWDIDYIKMDWCSTSGLDPQTQYTQFEQALTAANANIYFSLCEWGVNSPWLWAPAIGNSWRTTGDISDNWSSMVNNLESSEAHAADAGPGGWNDPDMLEVGNGGMSSTQDQAHFAMWAMSAASLIAGNDLVGASSTTLATLTNANIIAIDQDPLGIQATIVNDNGAGLQVWSKEVTNGTAVALFNNSGSAQNITVEWSEVGLSSTQSVAVTNEWTGQSLGNYTGSYTANVPSDDATILMLGKGGGASCTAVPSAPGGLTATAASSSAINLSWAADTPPANCTISSYSVFRSTTSGFTPSSSNQAASGVTGTSYSNTGLAASTTYYYKVEALDADGASAASAQSSAKTLAAGGSSFTLSRSASSLTVAQGSSATDTISVNDVNGFTGSITLAASGLPSGVTATFGTNPTTGSSVLTLKASSSATTGASTVTITGTSGSLSATTTIALTVTASSSCTPTAIVPYINTASAGWVEESSISVASGTVVDIGPQPNSGGSWAWTGPNGFTSTSREIDSIPLSAGANVYTATYTNSCGAKSTQAFTITVTGSSPGFTLSPSASTLTVKQGTSGTDTITVTDVGGFTGSVAFTAAGLPSGVTASFSPASSASSSVLTLTASSTATTGAFTITVTGTSGSTKATTTITLSVSTSGGGSACTVDYTISSQTSSAFGAAITIINNGITALSNWTLTWSFANGQTISASWNGTESQSGANVTVTEQSGQTWENIPAGGSYSGFGLNGTWNGTTNAIPTAFLLNGTACTVN